MKHFLLFYEVGPEYLERRAEFRAAHLQKAWALADRGELLLAGAILEPVDGAVLLFRGESKDVAEEFARTDPYVLNGLVKRWQVREWATVVGNDATAPLRTGVAS
ncbi:MAG TPA: YciI-like protein [Vicinamibacterales bacterium]|nr:YciI-like protein [Vicinamibacterales bacterium]